MNKVGCTAMKQSWAFNPAFCTAIFLSSIAFAQTADPNRFQQFLASAFHKGLVLRAISLIPKDVFQTCPTLKSSGPAVAVTRPVTFGQDGRMTSGAWWERLPVSGCNNDTVLNIFLQLAAIARLIQLPAILVRRTPISFFNTMRSIMLTRQPLHRERIVTTSMSRILGSRVMD